MKTPRNYDAGSVASHDLFAPFVDVGGPGAPYYILCMDGATLLDHEVLKEEDDFTHEWHIDYMGGEIYQIEYSKAPELCTQVYRGKIPTREAFLTIMANVEDAPSWANVKGVARREEDGQSEAREGRCPPLPLPSCSLLQYLREQPMAVKVSLGIFCATPPAYAAIQLFNGR